MYYLMLGVYMFLMTVAVLLTCMYVHMRRQRRSRSVALCQRNYYKMEKQRILRNKRDFLERILTEKAKTRVRWELVHICNFGNVPFKKLFPPNYKDSIKPLEEHRDGVMRPKNPLKGLITH